MAIIKADIQSAVESNLVLSGRPVQIAKTMAEHGVRLGVKMVWRHAIWSFSIRKSALTLTANDTDGYVVPDDCEQVGGVRRLTTNDYGWRLVGMSETEFDNRFPNPAAHNANSAEVFKIGYDATTKKPLIFVYPKSQTSDSAEIIYKAKYSNSVFEYIPDDYEPLCVTAALYHCTPAQAIEYSSARTQLYGELKDQLNQYKKRDTILIDQLVNRGSLPNMPYALGSWSYILAGGPYGA